MTTAVLPTDLEGCWCGCCGKEIPRDSEWCKDCLNHIDTRYQAAFDQTYYAQTGKECPYAED